MEIWLTNFSNFIQKVFGIGKKKESNELELSCARSTYEQVIAAADDLGYTVRACGNLMQYLPDVDSHKNIDKEELKNLLASLVIVRGFYFRSKKESDEVLFWLNQYIMECSKYGKASEERLKAKGRTEEAQ